MALLNAVQDFATQKAIRQLEAKVRELEAQISRLISNDVVQLSFDGLAVTVSTTEPAVPQGGAIWYKPGSPGNYYWSVENSSGAWIWVGPAPTGDTSA